MATYSKITFPINRSNNVTRIQQFGYSGDHYNDLLKMYSSRWTANIGLF